MENVKINLPMPVQFILNKLHDNGHEAYVVGGCVRDSIMGIKPHDWDICTSALPEQVQEVFKDFKVLLTGVQHGTVSVLLNSENDGIYEITTYRIDGEYKDNRHPDSVQFVSDLESDLARRDFTINAMAYNEESGLVDPFNGIEDITTNTIRCVGEANDRFKEDALRIMRAVRFALRFNSDIEFQTLAAMLNNKELLRKISAERICAELTKIFTRPLSPFNPSKYDEKKTYDKRVRLLLKTLFQLIETFVPEIGHINYRLAFYRLWFANSSSCSFNMAIIIQSSYLTDTRGICYNSPKSMQNIFKILKFSNDIINNANNIVSFGQRIMDDFEKWAIANNDIFPTEIKIQKYYARMILHNLDYYTANLALDYATILLIYSNLPAVYIPTYFECIDKLRRAVRVCRENGDVYDLKYLAIDGNDLIMLGFKGKRIGFILNELLDMVMKDEVRNTRGDLIRAVNDYFVGDDNDV